MSETAGDCAVDFFPVWSAMASVDCQDCGSGFACLRKSDERSGGGSVPDVHSSPQSAIKIDSLEPVRVSDHLRLLNAHAVRPPHPNGVAETNKRGAAPIHFVLILSFFWNAEQGSHAASCVSVVVVARSCIRHNAGSSALASLGAPRADCAAKLCADCRSAGERRVREEIQALDESTSEARPPAVGIPLDLPHWLRMQARSSAARLEYQLIARDPHLEYPPFAVTLSLLFPFPFPSSRSISFLLPSASSISFSLDSTRHSAHRFFSISNYYTLFSSSSLTLSMRTVASSLLGLLASGALATASNHHASSFERRSSHLQPRVQTDASFQSTYYASNYKNGDPAPGSLPTDSPGQTIIINSNNGTDNNSPVSSCPIAFIGGAAVVGSEKAGWESIAGLVGFDTMRLEVENNIFMPYYIERKDYTKAQRIVMVLQGKPRDAWRYPNLMRYTGMCAVSNPDLSVNQEDYIVTAPIIYNTDDLKAGGAQATDLVWSGGSWATGGITKGPGDTTYTTFKALDALVSQWFNTTMFPNVKSVVIAGHSAGAILAQRYAILREEVEGEDENMKWFISDAGAYAWPSDDRPIENPPESNGCKSNAENCEMTPACDARKNEWPYGLNISDPSTMNVYARSRIQKDKQGLLNTYLNRRIQYTYAELDNGPGDTHCEAQYQGASHIERGTNLMKALQQAGAKGASWTFVPNATHVDEELFIDPASQSWLFVDGLTDARNGTTKASKSSKKGGSGSTGSGSSGALGSVQVNGALIAGIAVTATTLLAACSALF